MIDKTMTQAPSIQGKTFNENPQAFNQKPVSKRDLIIRIVALAAIIFVAIALLSMIVTSPLMGLPLLYSVVHDVCAFHPWVVLGLMAGASLLSVLIVDSKPEA